MQLVCLIMYLCQHPIKHYSHCYEFIFLPLFSISFLKQSMSFSSELIMNSLRISLFLLGLVVSFVMGLTQYTRYPEDESESLIKISTNLRIMKLIKRFSFAILTGFNLVQPLQLTFLFMIGITALQFYFFITSFTFQNSFHQYLLLLATFTSMISWIDFILFYDGLTNYAFIGEIIFIVVIIFNPQIFQKALQLKYQIYGEKNIDTRKINELLAVLVVMKEIVLNERQNLKYTKDFENKMFTILQKMVAKNKISSQSYDEVNLLRQKDNLSQDQINFLKVLEKRLKENQEFIAYEFYLTTIVRKGFNYKNKALAIYYQRISEKGQLSTNIFNKIEMKMLYHHLMSHLQQKGKNEIHHAVLTFSDSLNQLKAKIINLCKHQISVVNLFQNSSNVPIQRYAGELIERHELKLQIKQKIDQLNLNQWHVHSGAFLYICLLYKIILQREQIIISEKINKNFVIPLANENRKSKFMISQYKNISIFVFSSKQKGLILNENQYFSKTYGRTVRSAQKSKKYVSQLFLSIKQKNKHQDLMQSPKKYDGALMKDHSTYDCWIRRRIVLKNNKLHDEQRLVTVVEKVKITARIYYQQQESQAFICTIELIDSGIETKLLAKDLQILKKYNIKFEITGQQTLQQLGENWEIYSVVNKSYEDSFIEEDLHSQDQSSVNVSQNFMYPLDFESIQHKKIEKIEKQYDKEEIQFDSRRVTLLFLAILPIISFLVTIIMSLRIDSLITESKQVMQYQKKIFEKTLISEKYVGLNLMLYQMVQNNLISNDMCQYFGVNNLQLYTVDNLLQFANNNFDEIQLTQIQGVDGDNDLQRLFDSRYYQFFEFQDPTIWMNYLMYTSLTKSSIYEYANLEGGKTFNQWSQITIANAINVSQMSYDGLYSKLKIKFQQIKSLIQQTIGYSLVIIYIVKSVMFIIVLVTFYHLIGYKYNLILLLKDFKKNYVKKRVGQMDFIITEINRLQKNQIYDVRIDKLMNLKMTRQNRQQTFNLQQFEKQSFTKPQYQKYMEESQKSTSMQSSSRQLEQQKEYLISGNQTLSSKNQTAPIMIMFSFHKYKLLGLIIFFVVSGALNYLQNQLTKERSMKIFLMEDLLDDMGLLLISMEDLLVGQVVKYKGEQIYCPHDLNEVWIRMDLDQLLYNKFQQKVEGIFPKQTQNMILYQSYCQRATNKAVCQSMKGGALTDGLSTLVGFLKKDYNITWDKPYSTNLIVQRQICQKFTIYVNYTINQYQTNLVQGYNNIEVGFTEQDNNLKIADGIVSIFLIIGIGIVAEIIIGRGRKVRAQVLSMDAKINLYQQYQTYRNILNRMYYKQEKDLVF